MLEKMLYQMKEEDLNLIVHNLTEQQNNVGCFQQIVWSILYYKKNTRRNGQEEPMDSDTPESTQRGRTRVRR